MFNPLNDPLLVLVVSLPTLWFATWIGASIRAKHRAGGEESHEDLNFVLGATLTLLGLIIGFTFSMAVGRYEQRKNYEEEEANAIGTEYVRADLLPAPDAAKVRELLNSYLDARILYYTTRGRQQLQAINAQTAQLQAELWSTVAARATAEPTAVMSLVLAGMNDVLNRQGYTQAAWWDRIPPGAWILLIAISIFCNFLIGYATRKKSPYLFLVLPIALSISLFLIADIDSPRQGLIGVRPQNLESLFESLHAH